MSELEQEQTIAILEQRLADSQQMVRALMSGEIDTLARDAGSTPILLQAAQQKLRANEQLLRAVFDGSVDAMLIADEDGRYIDANPAACALFGVEKHQLLGRRLNELAAPGYMAPPCWDSPPSAGPSRGELSFLRRDGQQRNLEYSTVANVLPDRHLSILRDVTERRKAEVALRETEQRLRTIISNAPIVLFAFDSDGICTLYEGKGVEDLNRTFEDRIGVSAFKTFGSWVGAEAAIRSALGGEITRWEGQTRAGFYEVILIPVFDASGIVSSVTGLGIDIGARRTAESALRSSEARFRAMIEKSEGGITLIDAGRKILYVSPSMDGISGRAAAELMGTSTFDFVHPDDRGPLLKVLSDVVEKRSTVANPEFRTLHGDGTIRWVEATATNLLEDPSIGAIVLNFRDVTGRKLDEMTLRESQRLLEDAQETGHLGSWVSGARPSDPISWSAECARIFGRDEKARPNGEDFLKLVHPDDRARIISMTENAVPDGPACEAEYRVLLPTGELRWIHARWAIEGRFRWIDGSLHTSEDEHGKTYRSRGIVQDITDRKRAEDALRATENRYRRIVENTSEGVWMYDGAGVTTFMSSRMAELLGSTVADAVGRPIFDFMSADVVVEAQNRLARRRSGIAERGELKLRRRDGTDLWVSVHADPLQDSVGTFEGSLALVTDITEQRRSRDALGRSEEQLRQAQKMEAIGSLAGGVAHDFNNLLSVILSYTDLATADLKPTDPLRADLEEVHKAGLRAAALTRQLLAFSRQQVLQPSVIEMNDVVTGVERMLTRLLGEDIEVSWITSPTAGKVHADAGQIEQVIMNLVVNARDAMPKGGHLTIETANVLIEEGYAGVEHQGLVPGSYVMLAVTDTGTGMSAATQDRVFEPFFTTKDKSKGTGLGLSMVYGIVKQSGGHISVSSELGKGTTFKMYLTRTERLAIGQSITAQSASLNGTETILLVEDEDQVRVLMSAILRKHGYKVLEAQNGGEAFLVCEQHDDEIHLLLTDVIMPRMSGQQLVERLAIVRPHMKALYVSGYTDNAILVHGIDGGAAFLQKPVQPEPLLRKVREVLDSGNGTSAA